MKKLEYFAMGIVGYGLLASVALAEPVDIFASESLLASSLTPNVGQENGLLLGAKLNRYASSQGLYWMNFKEMQSSKNDRLADTHTSRVSQGKTVATIRYGVLDIPIIK